MQLKVFSLVACNKRETNIYYIVLGTLAIIYVFFWAIGRVLCWMCVFIFIQLFIVTQFVLGAFVQTESIYIHIFSLSLNSLNHQVKLRNHWNQTNSLSFGWSDWEKLHCRRECVLRERDIAIDLQMKCMNVTDRFDTHIPSARLCAVWWMPKTLDSLQTSKSVLL